MAEQTQTETLSSTTTTTTSSTPLKTMVVIGGGYSGLSFIQSIREIEKQEKQYKIILITREDFCSRPNLFFRFKFLQWHSKHLDYFGGIHLNGENNSFITKYGVDQVLFNTSVFDINNVEQVINYKTVGSDDEISLHYDTLCLCIGGKAHVVNYPTEVSNEKSVIGLNREQLIVNFGEIQSQISNYLYIRNIEQVEYIHQLMKQLYDYYESNENNLDHNRIVIIGSGTLSIDIVSHIIEGYEAIEKLLNGEASAQPSKQTIEEVWSIKNTNILPKITIIGRGKHLGKSLLRDEAACDMILKLAKEKYGKYLDIQLETQVESILYSDVNNLAHSVKTSNGIIPCSLIVQAVGVNSETSLATKCLDASLGVNGGILVDEHFQIHSNNSTIVPNIYCIGDCAEITTQEGKTNVWKNWTSAREQASACAHHILSKKNSKLFFSQTPKFFGLHITCLGEYDSTDSNLQTIVIDEQIQKNIYMKFLFNTIGEQYQLIGALIIGPNMNEYKLGLNFLQLLKEHVYLPKAIINNTQLLVLNFNINYWSKLMSLVKARKKDTPFETPEEIEKLLSELTAASEKKATPAVNPLAKKKFVNPLEKKKQTAASSTSSPSPNE